LKKVENLIAIFNVGHTIGQLSNALGHPAVTPMALLEAYSYARAQIGQMQQGDPLPFEATKRSIVRLRNAMDSLYEECKTDRAKLEMPLLGTPHQLELRQAISGLQAQLAHDLDTLPIWLVTERRAYSLDALINNAELILEPSHVSLLSGKTVTDIREAGRAIAFDLPTAAGFHSMRSVEAVARGYHTVVVGSAPKDGEPLGPVINNLRTKRDAMMTNNTIDKEDMLHLVIETLNRVNNVYRKPITHPDMVLDSAGAMNVFDASKCAIELMLEDALRKAASPITPGFF